MGDLIISAQGAGNIIQTLTIVGACTVVALPFCAVWWIVRKVIRFVHVIYGNDGAPYAMQSAYGEVIIHDMDDASLLLAHENMRLSREVRRLTRPADHVIPARRPAA